MKIPKELYRKSSIRAKKEVQAPKNLKAKINLSYTLSYLKYLSGESNPNIGSSDS